MCQQAFNFAPNTSRDSTPPIEVDLHDYDLVIVNSSAGKDSLCSIYEVCRLAGEQNYPNNQIVVSHQDLGRMEWADTSKLAREQAGLFNLDFEIIKRIDKHGKEEDLLEYAERRGKWPSSTQRWCTSDFKRGPGSKILRRLSKEREAAKILYVFGFRAEESPARSKREVLVKNKQLSTKKRIVHDWLPIHDWSEAKVWNTIRENELPYHKAYDLGMPRLSCVFCIFSPKDALVIAGKHNPELLDEYIATEKKIGHTFQHKKPIADIKIAIENGYEPATKISNWRM